MAKRKRPAAAKPEPDQADAGLVCRNCGCRHFFVIYTRARPGRIMRRRECRNCGRRMTTWEKEPG